MSSSDAELDLGDGSGEGTLEGITTFLQDGGKAGTVLSASILGLVVSPFVALGNVIQAVGEFFAQPFTAGGNAIGALITGIFEAPGDLLDAGADISESALRATLGETLAGTLALPITFALVMLSLYMVTRYLLEEETGDVLPAVPIDIPTDIFGVEEEETIDE